MNVLICDKCGRHIDGKIYERIQITKMIEWKHLPVTYDLCMDCFANLVKFMGEEKRNEEWKVKDEADKQGD